MDIKLKQWLSDHNIEYTLHTHPAVFTVPEANIHCGHIPGSHIKNLFLRNKKTDQFYLVTIPGEARLDLKQFRKSVGAPKVRFANAEDLFQILGITPGAVSPLGLINDTENRTVFIIEKKLWNADMICAHPNINTETLQITSDNFHRLIHATGNTLEVQNLPYIQETEEEE